MLTNAVNTEPDFRNARFVRATGWGVDLIKLGALRDASALGEKRLALAKEAHLFIPADGTLYVAQENRIESLEGYLVGRVHFRPQHDVILHGYPVQDVTEALRPRREPTDDEIMAQPRMQELATRLAGGMDSSLIRLANDLTLVEASSPELHRFLWDNARADDAEDEGTILARSRGDVDSEAPTNKADEEEDSAVYHPGDMFEVSTRRLRDLTIERRLRLLSLCRIAGVMPSPQFLQILEAFVCAAPLAVLSPLALGFDPARSEADKIRAELHGDPLSQSKPLKELLYGELPFEVLTSERLPITLIRGEGVRVGSLLIDNTIAWARASIKANATGVVSAAPNDWRAIDPRVYTPVVEVSDWDAAVAAIERIDGWLAWDVGDAEAGREATATAGLTPDQAALMGHFADNNWLCVQLFQMWMAGLYCTQVAADALASDEISHIRSGLVRGYGVCRGLVGMSKEAHALNAGDRYTTRPLVLHGFMLMNMLDELTHPNRVVVAIATTVTSYLKSGHHSTAAHLDNTAARMLMALRDDSMIDVTELPGFLGLAVHYGTHPLDMRLLVTLLRHLNCYGMVNGAIGKRLAPEGPGNVAIVLGYRALTELKTAGFFQAVGRTLEMEQADAAFAEWSTTRWMETPYAMYLYGQSRAPDEVLRRRILDLFPLLDSLKDIMPNSTYHLSVALTKEVRSGAVNSIVAGLQVRAFARAFSQYLEGTVTRALTRR